MLQLSKLYNLINRNVKITLTDTAHREVYFGGYVKDIPDAYDSWKVIDIIEFSNYEIMIVIAEQDKNTQIPPQNIVHDMFQNVLAIIRFQSEYVPTERENNEHGGNGNDKI